MGKLFCHFDFQLIFNENHKETHRDAVFFLSHDINKENIISLRKPCYANLRFHGQSMEINDLCMRTKHTSTHWVLGQHKHRRTKDESKMVLNMVFKCVVYTWILQTIFFAFSYKKSLVGPCKLSNLRKLFFTNHHLTERKSANICLMVFIQKENCV